MSLLLSIKKSLLLYVITIMSDFGNVNDFLYMYIGYFSFIGGMVFVAFQVCPILPPFRSSKKQQNDVICYPFLGEYWFILLRVKRSELPGTSSLRIMVVRKQLNYPFKVGDYLNITT